MKNNEKFKKERIGEVVTGKSIYEKKYAREKKRRKEKKECKSKWVMAMIPQVTAVGGWVTGLHKYFIYF